MSDFLSYKIRCMSEIVVFIQNFFYVGLFFFNYYINLAYCQILLNKYAFFTNLKSK